MRTSELIGPALDWAVCVAEGNQPVFNPHRFGSVSYGAFESELGYAIKHYSTDWAQGGPIIEREGLSVTYWGERSRFGQHANKEQFWEARHPSHRTHSRRTSGYGPTPLIAAMRCYVASKLSDEVEIPEDLR